jgi:hypothetical protein
VPQHTLDWKQELVGAIGFEPANKRKRKDLQSTDGIQSIRKAVLIHIN